MTSIDGTDVVVILHSELSCSAQGKYIIQKRMTLARSSVLSRKPVLCLTDESYFSPADHFQRDSQLGMSIFCRRQLCIAPSALSDTLLLRLSDTVASSLMP